MTWNYRIVQRAGHVEVYEVYYNVYGTPRAMTAEPILMAEDVDDLFAMLKHMMEMDRTPFVPPENWTGELDKPSAVV